MEQAIRDRLAAGRGQLGIARELGVGVGTVRRLTWWVALVYLLVLYVVEGAGEGQKSRWSGVDNSHQ